MAAAITCEPRKRRCLQPKQQLDRISELSDEILGEILSLTPTKDAVKTSCLSKRWKSVWTSVHAVQIRDRDLFRCSSDSNLLAGFVNFVDRCFYHALTLRKLELDCNSFYVNQWLHIVTNKLHEHAASLDELDLTLSGAASKDRLVKLPPSIFTSKKLVVLKLSFNVEQLNLPSIAASSPVVWLPRLKVLRLRTSADVSSVENILIGCPVLEELHLSGTALHNELNKETLCIKSSSLKSFKLSFSYIVKSRIEIDASNLEELDLYFNPWNPIVVVSTSLPLLMRLTIHMSIRCAAESQDIRVYGNRLIELLTKAPNTKYLFLSSDAVTCLQHGQLYRQLPMLKNLTGLNMDVCSKSWPIVPWFLERWPSVVSFSIREDNSMYLYENIQLRFHETWPNCSSMKSLRQLEKVELDDFQGSDREMRLAAYIMKKAPVLKTMSFPSMSPTRKVALRLHNGIVKLPKASTTCKVISTFRDSRTCRIDCFTD